MTAVEFVLAIGGLACAVAALVLRVRKDHDMWGAPEFWAAAGLLLCQVLWIVRLAQ